MTIEFRVLGPLEVERDGERLPLGGRHPRAVLAALLLERNKVVAAHRLADAVWGEHPPSTHVALLWNLVKALRQVLGTDRDRILTRPPGYRIDVRPGELDLDVFAAKRDAGLTALRSDDPARAADLLRAAEATWRGAALTDLADLPVHDFAVRLDRLRVVARDARILADLMLGRHLELVPELQAVEDRTHQLDGCLMVALHRCGRGDEALTVFDAVGRAADELGLDPPRELSALHRALLDDDDVGLGAWVRRTALPTDTGRPRAQDDVTRRPWTRPARPRTPPGAPVAAAVTLTVTSGSGAGRSYRYTERRTCRVGRGDDCDPQFARDPLVSRLHCRLDIDPPRIWVRDEGSRNGTFVNRSPIGRPVPLADGDEIRLGDVTVTVLVEDGLLAPTADGDVPDPPGYRRLRELSRGPTSTVHLVERCDTGERAVLKILLHDGADRRAEQAFLREVEVSRLLRHPHIVTLRDSGTTGPAFFLVSDHCDGGSLADLLTRPLPVDEALALTRQVLDGLDYAHGVPIPRVRLADGTSTPARGVVHRDVKPSNVLLVGPDADRTAKLADFGLAKAFETAGLSGHTGAHRLGGTLAYMCRQQVRDYRDATPAVDVWATAATLYRMLSGSTPRDFPADADPVLVVLDTMAVPLRERVPAVPAPLAAVLDEALRDDRDLAFTSAAQLRSALEEAR